MDTKIIKDKFLKNSFCISFIFPVNNPNKVKRRKTPPDTSIKKGIFSGLPPITIGKINMNKKIIAKIAPITAPLIARGRRFNNLK